MTTSLSAALAVALAVEAAPFHSVLRGPDLGRQTGGAADDLSLVDSSGVLLLLLERRNGILPLNRLPCFLYQKIPHTITPINITATSNSIKYCVFDDLPILSILCLLYTSDAADEEDSVDLGGRRI